MESKYNFTKAYKEQIERCSRCGFCQAHCPVFGATLRPAYNARGKMLLAKEVLEGRLELTDELIETIFQCTTCASCATNCPSGVEVPEIIKAFRRDMVNVGSCHPAFTGMNEVLDKYDNIYAEKDGEDFDREKGKKAEYVYFMGCVGQYREEDPTEATLDLLDHLKVDYTLIDEVCCGGVLEDVGHSMKPHLAEKNIDLIKATGAKTVITGCPYCFRTFTGKELYKPLRQDGIEIVHISQLLATQDIGVKTDLKVTYHDPCDLGRHTGIYEEPRATIKKIAPNFVELPNHHADSLCCGAGGGVRGAYAKNSLAMARRRLDQVEEIGADILLTECNSCVHNLVNAKLRKQKFEVYTTPQFIMELLD
jgi:Fe-S oxidoreductase